MTTLNTELFERKSTEQDILAEAEMMADAIMDELDLDELDHEIAQADACVIMTGNRYDDISNEGFNREKVARLRRLIADGTYPLDMTAVAEALLQSGNL
ncbi:MAG: flagellar biosynthesis anti-sigma factor FlgM [Myxococcota bacterium]